MYDDLMISSAEPLVPTDLPVADWSRVPPATRRPAPSYPPLPSLPLPAPRFGQKKKPVKKKDLHFYQLVTRGRVQPDNRWS